MAEEIGVGYVRLVPTMQGFAGAAQRQMSGAIAGPAKAAGATAGTNAAAGFRGTMAKGMGKLKGTFSSALKGAAGGAAGAVGAFMAFDKVTELIGSSISAASDLNETVNKSSVIFGKNAGAIDTWAKGASTSLGLSRQAALDFAAGFGDMFTQIGFSGDAAAAMSKQVVQLSADLGSFNNLGTDDVADRISAAFRGEYDSLQAVIPNINAARVEQEAMAATGKKTASALTAQEKAAAVLAIVQKDGARAAGDFAKTSNGLANSQKIQAAEAANLKAQLGQGLLPIQLKLTQAGIKFLQWGQENSGMLKTLAIIVGGALVGAFTALAVAVIAATWPFIAVGAAIAALALGFVWLWKHSEKTRTVVTAVGAAIVAAGKWIAGAAQAVWSALTKFWAWVTSGSTWQALGKWLVKPFVDGWRAIQTGWRAFSAWVRAAFKTSVAFVKTAGRTLLTWYTWPYRMAWKGIRAVLGAAGRFIRSSLRGWANIARTIGGQIRDRILTPLRSMASRARNSLNNLVAWVRKLPGRFSSALAGLWNGLKAGFRSAVNWVIGRWNALSFRIGGGSIMGKKIPSVTLSTPDIPYLAHGGIAMGPTLAMIGEGSEPEAVVPLSKLGQVAARAGAGMPVQVIIDGSGLDRGLMQWLRHAVRVNGGGSVQAAFGQTRG